MNSNKYFLYFPCPFFYYFNLERRYMRNSVKHPYKFTFFRIVKNKAKEEVLPAIKEIFSIMGASKIQQSDNREEFSEFSSKTELK